MGAIRNRASLLDEPRRLAASLASSIGAAGFAERARELEAALARAQGELLASVDRAEREVREVRERLHGLRRAASKRSATPVAPPSMPSSSRWRERSPRAPSVAS